jgi:hypothetical protein
VFKIEMGIVWTILVGLYRMRGVGGLYEHRSDGSATRMGFGKLQIEDTPANDDHRSVYVTIKKRNISTYSTYITQAHSWTGRLLRWLL